MFGLDASHINGNSVALVHQRLDFHHALHHLHIAVIEVATAVVIHSRDSETVHKGTLKKEERKEKRPFILMQIWLLNLMKGLAQPLAKKKKKQSKSPNCILPHELMVKAINTLLIR